MAGWKPDSGMGPNIPRSPGARQLARALGPADRLERQPAHRGNALDGLADFVVGRRGPGRDADGDGTRREPRRAVLLLLRPDGAKPDRPLLGSDAGRVLDVVGGHLLLADREIGRASCRERV